MDMIKRGGGVGWAGLYCTVRNGLLLLLLQYSTHVLETFLDFP